jgi:hypothetical protein
MKRVLADKVRVTYQLRLECHRLRALGKTAREIHQIMNIPTGTVYRLLHEDAGAPEPVAKRQPWSYEDTVKLKQMIAEGVRFRDIRKAFPQRGESSLATKVSTERYKMFKAKRPEVVPVDDGPVVKAPPVTVPTVYRYTKHSGMFLDNKRLNLRRTSRELGACVTSQFFDNGPGREKLHGLVQGESNHHTDPRHPNAKYWRM